MSELIRWTEKFEVESSCLLCVCVCVCGCVCYYYYYYYLHLRDKLYRYKNLDSSFYFINLSINAVSSSVFNSHKLITFSIETKMDNFIRIELFQFNKTMSGTQLFTSSYNINRLFRYIRYSTFDFHLCSFDTILIITLIKLNPIINWINKNFNPYFFFILIHKIFLRLLELTCLFNHSHNHPIIYLSTMNNIINW